MMGNMAYARIKVSVYGALMLGGNIWVDGVGLMKTKTNINKQTHTHIQTKIKQTQTSTTNTHTHTHK